jgi:hypothetical protein
MRFATVLAVILSADLLAAATAMSADNTPAKVLFSRVATPAPYDPRPVGA